MEHVHPQRTAQTGDGVSTRPQTATAEAMEPPENAVDGEKETVQDEGEQRRAAVQTMFDPGRGDGGVLEYWDTDARCNTTRG